MHNRIYWKAFKNALILHINVLILLSFLIREKNQQGSFANKPLESGCCSGILSQSGNTSHTEKNKLPTPTKDWGELDGPPRRGERTKKGRRDAKTCIQHVGFGIRIAL